ncbi:MAG: eCIS core domain-containing protein [Acidimicrobiales bacterium]
MGPRAHRHLLVLFVAPFCARPFAARRRLAAVGWQPGRGRPAPGQPGQAAGRGGRRPLRAGGPTSSPVRSWTTSGPAPDPDSSSGQELLAHELTHTIQRRG